MVAQDPDSDGPGIIRVLGVLRVLPLRPGCTVAVSSAPSTRVDSESGGTEAALSVLVSSAGVIAQLADSPTHEFKILIMSLAPKRRLHTAALFCGFNAVKQVK